MPRAPAPRAPLHGNAPASSSAPPAGSRRITKRRVTTARRTRYARIMRLTLASNCSNRRRRVRPSREAREESNGGCRACISMPGAASGAPRKTGAASTVFLRGGLTNLFCTEAGVRAAGPATRGVVMAATECRVGSCGVSAGTGSACTEKRCHVLEIRTCGPCHLAVVTNQPTYCTRHEQAGLFHAVPPCAIQRFHVTCYRTNDRNWQGLLSSRCPAAHVRVARQAARTRSSALGRCADLAPRGAGRYSDHSLRAVCLREGVQLGLKRHRTNKRGERKRAPPTLYPSG